MGVIVEPSSSFDDIVDDGARKSEPGRPSLDGSRVWFCQEWEGAEEDESLSTSITRVGGVKLAVEGDEVSIWNSYQLADQPSRVLETTWKGNGNAINLELRYYLGWDGDDVDKSVGSGVVNLNGQFLLDQGGATVLSSLAPCRILGI